MKLALIKPPQKTIEIIPPLGLGYLASAVRDIIDVRIINCIKDDLEEKEVIDKIIKEDFDMIGFQVFSENFNIVKRIIKNIRKMKRDLVIVVGGAHPTLAPEHTINNLDINYCFIGEAERSLRKLISGINPREIEGIAFKEKDKLIINPPKFIEDLDDYNPVWDILKLESYPHAPHGSFCKQSPSAPIIITRGCPFNCSYCGATKISGYKIRSHSLSFIIKQIEVLVNDYGIKEIHIEDDNFTLNRDFVKEFCEKLIEKNFGITWTCPNGVRLDTLDKELILLMKKSGLYSLYVGIESGSDKIRKDMRKKLTTKTIKEKIKMIRECGIDIIGFFIIGYPKETLEDIKQTVDFACELDLKRAAFNSFKPLQGTDIYKELLEKKEVPEINYDDFSYDTVVYAPKGIGLEELRRLRRNAYFRFYFRPKQMFWMLKEMRNIKNLKSFFRRIFLFKSRYKIKEVCKK